MKKNASSRIRKIRASMVKRFNLLFHSGYSVESAYGRKFLIDWRHPVDKKVAFQMFEHERLMNFIDTVATLKPDAFLDVGAHSGLYSVLVSSRLSDLDIHAFEPDSTNRGQLHANLFLNRLCDRINVHPYGLSDHDGSLSFSGSDEHEHRAFSKISDSGGVQVSVKRLDGVFPFRDRKLAMKIDVEGHELEVLRGAVGLLAGNSCYIQIESSQENVVEVKKILGGMGYRWLGSDGDHYFTNISGLVK